METRREEGVYINSDSGKERKMSPYHVKSKESALVIFNSDRERDGEEENS